MNSSRNGLSQNCYGVCVYIFILWFSSESVHGGISFEASSASSDPAMRARPRQADNIRFNNKENQYYTQRTFYFTKGGVWGGHSLSWGVHLRIYKSCRAVD